MVRIIEFPLHPLSSYPGNKALGMYEGYCPMVYHCGYFGNKRVGIVQSVFLSPPYIMGVLKVDDSPDGERFAKVWHPRLGSINYAEVVENALRKLSEMRARNA